MEKEEKVLGLWGRVSRILLPIHKAGAFIYLSSQGGLISSFEECDSPGTVAGGPPGSLLCLAPDWVFPASLVALGAVSS